MARNYGMVTIKIITNVMTMSTKIIPDNSLIITNRGLIIMNTIMDIKDTTIMDTKDTTTDIITNMVTAKDGFTAVQTTLWKLSQAIQGSSKCLFLHVSQSLPTIIIAMNRNAVSH